MPIDPMTLMLAWLVGLYGFSVRWRWIGGVWFVAVSIPLMLPILH